MGMTVVGVTSSPRKVAGFDRVHAMGELMTVLPTLDYLVLLTPYSPATHHMIDAKVFAAMKPSSYFINVARGGVVDEDAMIEALRAKTFAGAALDVFSQEPLDPSSPYWDLPNVIITPHTSGAMQDYWTPLVALFSENLRRFEKGAPLMNVVDKVAGY
jgi:phosphoglycerate dehydrogenase-like enzyme